MNSSVAAVLATGVKPPKANPAVLVPAADKSLLTVAKGVLVAQLVPYPCVSEKIWTWVTISILG